MLDPRLAENLLRIVNDPSKHGVPELHFRFWNVADEATKRAYVEAFENDPECRRYYEARYLAPPFDFDALGQLPENTLGRAYHDHIERNGLSPQLANDYRKAHDVLDAAGILSGMPDEIKYAIVRGFQTHDILHPLTGYDTSPSGELALQAFTLAQMRHPYAAFWMSIATTRIAFLDPQGIERVMDAIARGWQHGRRSRNLLYERWEELFDRPLDELRQAYALV